MCAGPYLWIDWHSVSNFMVNVCFNEKVACNIPACSEETAVVWSLLLGGCLSLFKMAFGVGHAVGLRVSIPRTPSGTSPGILQASCTSTARHPARRRGAARGRGFGGSGAESPVGKGVGGLGLIFIFRHDFTPRGVASSRQRSLRTSHGRNDL